MSGEEQPKQEPVYAIHVLFDERLNVVGIDGPKDINLLWKVLTEAVRDVEEARIMARLGVKEKKEESLIMPAGLVPPKDLRAR